MKVNINTKSIFQTWDKPLVNLLNSSYFNRLLLFLKDSYKFKKISPEIHNVFKAFEITPYNDLKIVILGQDPYPDKKATGLAFANKDEVGGSLSPSLSKIKNCIENKVYDGFNIDFDPTLESWAKQGVLLLNTALTVEQGKIGSHEKYWQIFTEDVIKVINDNNNGIIFMLWGKHAHSYAKHISTVKHYVMTFNHPAWAHYNKIPWDCEHFNRANELIKDNYGPEFCIEW